jgi:hypothetical protein
MRKAISLFLVFSMLVLSIPLIPKEKRGADLIIQKTDGSQVRGELIAVKNNSLVLLGLSPMVDVTVDIADLKIVRIVNRTNTLSSAGIGLLSGAVLGGAVGLAITDENSYWFRDSTADLVAGILFGGILGALLGGLGGLVSGTDDTILIEGKSEPEIKYEIEKLRKKARIKN